MRLNLKKEANFCFRLNTLCITRFTQLYEKFKTNPFGMAGFETIKSLWIFDVYVSNLQKDRSSHNKNKCTTVFRHAYCKVSRGYSRQWKYCKCKKTSCCNWLHPIRNLVKGWKSIGATHFCAFFLEKHYLFLNFYSCLGLFLGFFTFYGTARFNQFILLDQKTLCRVSKCDWTSLLKL